jgi:hypothetical protein
MKSAAELRRELEQAEARERLEKKAKKDQTPPKFEYWITPADRSPNGQFSYGKLYDPTCLLYTLERRITNKDAAKAAGWDDSDMREGSAVYLYNVVTRRIVCAVGGGQIYISCNAPFGAEDYADDTAMYQIGAYLAEFPGGGEISWIYEQYRADRKHTQEANKASSNGNKTTA